MTTPQTGQAHRHHHQALPRKQTGLTQKEDAHA